MKNVKLQKLYYHLRNRYFATNNIVVLGAFIIALSWAWGSVSVMDRNYKLQRELDTKNRQLKLVQLETDTLKYQQNYYKSDEYKEIAVRQVIGLAQPGEKALILPANSAGAIAFDTSTSQVSSTSTQKPIVKPSNFEQWTNFLFGEDAKGL